MSRRPDWPERLFAHVASRARTPFAWGAHDCVLFAADGVLAMTGRDLAAGWRGRWRSEIGARRVLARHFGGSLEEAVSVGLGLGRPLPSARLALRGDVMLYDTPDGPGLALCLGAAMAAPSRVVGVELLPRARASRAWRI